MSSSSNNIWYLCNETEQTRHQEIKQLYNDAAIPIYKFHLRSTYVIEKTYLGQRQRSHMGTLRN